jgi:hypothetical protein
VTQSASSSAAAAGCCSRSAAPATGKDRATPWSNVIIRAQWWTNVITSQNTIVWRSSRTPKIH